MRGNLVWNMVCVFGGNLVWNMVCVFVPSKAGFTKLGVFHESGLSKEVLLYIHTHGAIKHTQHSNRSYAATSHMT